MAESISAITERYLPGARSWVEAIGVDRVLTIGAFFIGSALMFLYHPFSQMVVGDPAIYDYIAQSILRGAVPYRDIVDIKGPLSPYISAAAVATGNLAGIRDVIAIRLLHILLVGLLSALTYSVAAAYLKSRLAAVIAFLTPLVSIRFAEMMIEGTQPKLTMIVFGMFSLLLIARDRPFWAGFASMLSCLCWQPGLLFTGVVVLIVSRYLTTWSDLRAVKAIAGAIIPLAVAMGYLYTAGGLSYFWAYTFTYNTSVFGPGATRTLDHAFTHLGKITLRVYRAESELVIIGLAGLIWFTAARIRERIRRSPDLFRDAILFPPAIYFAFSLINFQAGPDFIPFFPFVGIFAGWLIVSISRVTNKTVAPNRRWEWAPALVAAALLLSALVHGVRYKIPRAWTLQEQDRELKVVSDLLKPGDKIYVHGTTELLVLLNRPNLTPYLLLDWGMDEFIAVREYGGSFDALIARMDAERPKIVALSRLKTLVHADKLERWVQDKYERIDLPKYERVFVRKESLPPFNADNSRN
jgi:hypothetical protein